MLPRDRPVVFSHRFLLAGGIRFRNLLGSDQGLALSELIVQRVCVCLHILFTERKKALFFGFTASKIQDKSHSGFIT